MSATIRLAGLTATWCMLLGVAWLNAADCLKNTHRNMACPETAISCPSGYYSGLCTDKVDDQIQLGDFDCWPPNSTTDRTVCVPVLGFNSEAFKVDCLIRYECKRELADGEWPGPHYVCVPNLSRLVGSTQRATYTMVDCPPVDDDENG